jgi:ankyrin repeat protein
MTKRFQPGQAAALVAAFALLCGGCVLFHKHSAYRHIHEYAKSGDVAAVAADLAEYPADLNLPDDAGLTPLHLAALHCHTNVMALLIAKGADVNRKAKDATTPLHVAAQEGCTEGVEILLFKGAKINVRDSQGRTPLKRAEMWHQNAVAELLRQHGGTE